jgi:integrase
MSVQRVGTGKWRITVRVRDQNTGETKQVKRIFSGTKTEAKNYETELSDSFTPSSKDSLNEYWGVKWLPQLAVASVTEKEYRQSVKRLSGKIGYIALKDLDTFTLENALLDMPEGSIRHKCRKLLSKSLNDAKRWKLIKSNPMNDVQVADGKGEERDYELYDIEEINLLLAAVHGHVCEATVLTMIGCGLRKEEALGFQWSDINLESGALHVTKAWAQGDKDPIMKDTKNGHSSRMVYLSGYPLDRLREIAVTVEAAYELNNIGGNESSTWESMPIWPGEKWGRPRPESVNRPFKAIVEAAGLRYIPISMLRHVHATTALSLGVDVSLVSKDLGHSRISTTVDRYIKPLEDARKKAAQTFGDSLKPSLSGHKKVTNLGE